MPSPKTYRDPLLQPQSDEWRTEQNAAGHWLLLRNGRVVFFARTEEELTNWWHSKHPTLPWEPAGNAVIRAIERLR